MFNVMVTAADNAWEEGAYTWDCTRILEYSSDDAKAIFHPLTSASLAEIVKLPTLFMYERGTEGTARVGTIKRVQQRGTEIRVIFEFEQSIPPLDIEQIQGLKWELALSEAEFTRTHWAVKDGSLVEILIEGGILERPAPAPAVTHAEAAPDPTVEVTPAKIFLVHGRDDGTKNTVARFLERRAGLEVIILSERLNAGRSILTKFTEESAGADFAVVLMTGDDLAALKPEFTGGRPQNPTPRARQNVVFEMGFFIGKLGVDRVCVLVPPGVEKPSDYDGVVYVPLDDQEGWQRRLITELHGANVPVSPTWWQA